jgi:RNA polymerase sigma-70 factor (ECF subfamily)
MSASNPNELKNIVEKAKSGNMDAFSYLYETYFMPLYRYVYFRVGNKEDAEDLTQDIFVKIYLSFLRYSDSGKSPLAYFYTIARNTVIDYRRKKKILVADDEFFTLADSADTPLEEAMKKENADMVRAGIARLPESEQDVVVLRFMSDLSTKEIASTLGKSEEAVRQLQSRGLQSLRKKILYE